MKRFEVKISKGRFKIYGLVHELGEDLLVSIWGGTQPHIGAIGAATPRPSLKNDKKWSATSSNLTFTGHKEDILSKKISEELAARLRKNVVVTAGVHWDHLTSKEIKTIENLVQKIPDQIIKKIPTRPPKEEKKR